MRVLADEERSVDALVVAILDDCGGGGHDVGLVERRVERGSTVTGRAEHHPLVGDAWVGYQVVVRAQQGIDVDEVFRKGNCACALMHGASLASHTRKRRPPLVMFLPCEGKEGFISR